MSLAASLIQACSVSRKQITFRESDNQWSFWNWSRLAADKSKVATTARRERVYQQTRPHESFNRMSMGVACGTQPCRSQAGGVMQGPRHRACSPGHLQLQRRWPEFNCVNAQPVVACHATGTETLARRSKGPNRNSTLSSTANLLRSICNCDQRPAGAQVKAAGHLAGPTHLHDRSLFSEACTVACATASPPSYFTS